MLKYEFKQQNEFSNPYYDVIFVNEIDEYPVGFLYFSGGKWNYADYGECGLPMHLMIKVFNKMKEFNKSVKEQLFLGKF
jgi:hypothetical protein